jgi:hypothetical protein
MELEVAFASDQDPRDAAVGVEDRAKDDVGIDDKLHLMSRLRFVLYHVRFTSAANWSTTFCGTL